MVAAGLILILVDPIVDFQLKLMDLAKDMCSDIMNLSCSVHLTQRHNSRSKKGSKKGVRQKRQVVLDSLTRGPKPGV